MNKPHPHATSMLLYAEDAAETETPWTRWQIKLGADTSWTYLDGHPKWFLDSYYRRKPKVILVNGFEVPEPMRTKPRLKEKYYLADVTTDFADVGIPMPWEDDVSDNRWLEAGLIHKTKEAALAHIQAMLAPSKQ